LVIRHHLWAGSSRRRLLAILACASLVWLVATLPALAAGPLRLSSGSVSPDSGPAGTTFTFAVTYTSKDDLPPAWVRLTLDGSARTMAAVDADATDYRAGVRYRLALPLAAGLHTFTFAAGDGRARVVSLAGGSLRVTPTAAATTAPATPSTAPPAGDGEPEPTPPPDADPGSDGAPEPGPDGSPPAERTQRPEARARSAPTLEPSPGVPEPQPTARPGVGLLPRPPDEGTDPDGMDPDRETAGAGPTGGPESAPGGEPGPDEQAWLAPAGAVSGSGRFADEGTGALSALSAHLPGFGSERWLRLALQGAAVSTTASVTMAMALFTFRRRRGARDESGEPNDAERDPGDGERDPAGSGHQGRDDAPQPTAALPAAPAALSQLVAAAAAATDETHMPRWRRPSLMAARKAAPGTDEALLAAERLTFDHGSANAGRERRRIRYRLVRLSDGPDEIVSGEIGRLDEGDEVELVESSGSYWRVRTPTGHEGWVHRMTLGEIVTTQVTPAPAGGPGSVAGDLPLAYATAGGDGPAAEELPAETLAARFIRERAGH
jgi:hypothetical protein